MTDEYDILDTVAFRKQTISQFNVSLYGVADAIDRHRFFGSNWERYVPGSQQFREHAALIKELSIGAERGDRAMKEQLYAARALAQLHLETAAKYMEIRAVEQKDPTLLHDTGFPIKAKPVKSSAVSPVSVPITLRAKHVRGKSGVALIQGKHVRGGGPYHLMICKGDPVSEESWYSSGGHYSSCSRIVVPNLEPANRYSFRMRTDGPAGRGDWSSVVSLIIL